MFAEGTGTRRLRPSDAGRLIRRLKRTHDRTIPCRVLPASVSLISPSVIPYHVDAVRSLNKWLLARSVRAWLDYPGVKTLWTYTPFTYGLENRANIVIYHLVDLLHENLSAQRAALLKAERELSIDCDVAIGSSSVVASHLRSQGFEPVQMMENVADTEVFSMQPERKDQDDTRPVILLTGALLVEKLDVELLRRLASELQGIATVRFIGPVSGSRGSQAAWRELKDAGVEMCAPLPTHKLANALAAATVGVIPYRLTPLTAGISPLKLYEFLASGLPVVATPLPSIKEVEGAVLVRPASEFVEAVAEIVACRGSGWLRQVWRGVKPWPSRIAGSNAGLNFETWLTV